MKKCSHRDRDQDPLFPIVLVLFPVPVPFSVTMPLQPTQTTYVIQIANTQKRFEVERKGLEFQEMGFNPIFAISIPTTFMYLFVIAKAITSAVKRPLDLLRCSVKRFCVIFPYAQLYCLLNRISYVRLFQELLVTGEFDTGYRG